MTPLFVQPPPANPKGMYHVIRTIETDLYVMQNEHGLIKIGQSVDPDSRRKTLAAREVCRLELVLVLPGKGNREKAIHRRLRAHHIEGEWFDGTDEAKGAIEKVIRKPLAWPFELSEYAAGDWLDGFFERRDAQINEKHFQRLLRRVRLAITPDWTVDGDIWHLLCLSESGEKPIIDVSTENGETTLTAFIGPDSVVVHIPKYSSDKDAAMTLWPASAAVTAMDGTALEVCIAALEYRHRLLSKGYGS